MPEIEGKNRREEISTTDSAASPEAPQAVEMTHLNTRRRLIQAGLLSLPVLMTVRSRPAFAQSLGSAGIPYGAYLIDNQGNFILDDQGNLIPVKTNEFGEAVDIDGNPIQNHQKQEVMMDPNRRFDSTMNYNDFLKVEKEEEK